MIRKKVFTVVIVFIVYTFITILSAILYEFTPILIKFGMYSDASFWYNIIVSMHNNIIDFIFMGCLLAYLIHKIDKKNGNELEKYRLAQIKKSYFDSIDDVRFWFTEEAAYRNLANIKRLQELEVFVGYNLSKSMLSSTKICDMQLLNSDFRGAQIENATFKKVELNNSKLNGVNFTNTKLENVDILNSELKYANFSNCTGRNLNFSDSNMKKANLEGADFKSCIFKNVDFLDVNFDNCNLNRANLIGANNLDVNQLLKCSNRDHLMLDDRYRQILENLDSE